jgi:hypothetical protein
MLDVLNLLGFARHAPPPGYRATPQAKPAPIKKRYWHGRDADLHARATRPAKGAARAATSKPKQEISKMRAFKIEFDDTTDAIVAARDLISAGFQAVKVSNALRANKAAELNSESAVKKLNTRNLKSIKEI